ncbi:DNA-directed RNA polymerase subunit beta' [Candidatus Nomurabacteria bacterium]|nr:DNA-directed RNA polymerase subunit beta' [Candidatus Nomurabacteria bacterium]
MKTFAQKDFNQIHLKLASPEDIVHWSYGEVTKPETINYRTGRSERFGLFDERIFGPEKDYECYCGKYKRIRYAGIVCEKCGVEVTKSIVRRERMGHIELASPVAHIWFLKSVPSRMSLLMGITQGDIEKVIYFAGYIVTKVHESEKKEILKNLENEYKTKAKAVTDPKELEKLKELFTTAKKEINEIVPGLVMNEITFHHYSVRYGTCFEASIGAEAIYNIFKELDLDKLRGEIEERIEKGGKAEKTKLERRLSLVKSMQKSGIRPEWMFLTVLPVIPPALRPMVAIDGGRHASSDINDLYRRVINRNNRLKKLMEIGAPDVILRNEKRILQEAVDALLDNSMSAQNDSQAMSKSQKRALKSLSDNLKSKQGLFRQNLLGKRVDYSGRSVIVVGPQLALSQCGLPKHMALELFRPFVISKIIEQEFAFNIRGANRLIDDQMPEVWAILEEVIQGKYVLLNRAPTLHRLGIQAFQPTLIEGNAIQLHPLVCQAYNADFDGDQMAVYVPLSVEAQSEAANLMAATKNLLKPANGDPIATPRMDMVLGSFWMTKELEGEKGEGKYFSSPNDAILAYDYEEVDLRAKIKVLPSEKEKYASFGGKMFETTVGRLLFNVILPEDFPYLNEEITSKKMSKIVDECILRYGVEKTPKILDKIKNFGFKYATISGTTWGIDNVIVPEGKAQIVEECRNKEKIVTEQFMDGLLSEEERYQKVLEIWDGAKGQIEKLLKDQVDKRSPVYDLVHPGARGSYSNLLQMAGMKGLIQNTTGRIIDFPVIPSYKEGLSPTQYFITTHGSRKGLADTALNTAKAGYLTRRLVDVAQDVVITEDDCGTKQEKLMHEENVSGVIIPLSKHARGRILQKDVADANGNVVFKKGHLLSKEDADQLDDLGIKEVSVRTPLTCDTRYGICRKCYGLDLGRNKLVEKGEAVGIIAAQAIGEPGTQLTLRTFHAGGVAGVDITQGLPRVEEIFERRIPKNSATVATVDGEVIEIRQNGKDKEIVVLADSKADGKENEIVYTLAPHRLSVVKKGDKVQKGDLMTDGSADIKEVLAHGGQEKAEDYIMHEINKVYELQGASISRKHVEIIVKQMFSRRKITDSGDTDFSPGEIVETVEFLNENDKTTKDGGTPAKADTLVLGVSEVSITTKSWLSAASFQNTNRVLITNAIRGGVDDLRGLKENVIIGRLIPAGSGYKENKEE